MRRIPFIFALSVLLVPVSCSRKPESTASVEIIEGIEHVHNTAAPLHPEKSVTFEDELSIGGEAYEMLSRPMGFVVGKESNIYISDIQDQTIKVFDSEGEFIKSIGRKGEGPGEFTYIGSLTFLPDGRLLVMDSMAMRLNLFDPEGTYLTSHNWTHRPGRLLYATESACVMTEYVFGEGKDMMADRKLFVKKHDLEGNEIHTFGEFKAEELKTHTGTGSGGRSFIVGISAPYSPHSIFAADQARACLYHCVNDEYMIEVFDEDGKVIRRFDRPYKPLPFTGEDAEEFRSQYMKGLRKNIQGLAMPTVKTITPGMLVDDSGNLWVETYEEREEEDKVFTAYDIFNPDGYYEAKVWIDVKPEIFINGKMYRMHNDEETGYRMIRRYRVVWDN